MFFASDSSTETRGAALELDSFARLAAPVYSLLSRAVSFFPCSSAYFMVTSPTLAAVQIACGTRSENSSTRICAFMPKCRGLCLQAWRICELRFFSAVLVDLRALMIVASEVCVRAGSGLYGQDAH